MWAACIRQKAEVGTGLCGIYLIGGGMECGYCQATFSPEGQTHM